ncbi:hypothetical protein D3C81_2289440 [compost metagenome]
MHVTGKLVATARTAHAADQVAAAELGEKLFEVRQGNALPLGNICQRHRPVLRM